LIIVIVTAVATLGAALGIGVAVNGRGGKDTAPTAVRVEPALSGDLIELVSVPGEVQPEPHLKVPIAARVSARILELPYKEWDTVTKGNDKADPPVPPSLLVRLDAKDLEATLTSVKARYAAQEAQRIVTQARIDSQKAQILASEASLREARRDLGRQKELLATKDVSQSVVDAAETKVDELAARLTGEQHSLIAAEQELVVLKHQLDAATAEIQKAQEDYNNTIITSPIDGVVTRVRMKVGELAVVGVENNTLTSIMEVADLNQMVMMARVDETNVAQLKVGQPARVRMQAYRDEVFEGVVESVSPARAEANRMQEETNFFEAKIKLKVQPKPDRRWLYSGITADADIETSRHVGVRVPTQAVLGRPVDSLPDNLRNSPEVEKGKSFASVVYRFIDGKAAVTPVTVGASDETHTLIKSGLKEGEPVITGPFKVLDALAHDQKVTKQDVPPSATQPAAPPVTAPSTRPSTQPG
jgi:HlyD family secretion protein